MSDLNALADRLDMYAGWSAGRTAINDQRAAARILRAVAAAPGPLREWGDWVEWSDETVDWFDALADAVGEP